MAKYEEITYTFKDPRTGEEKTLDAFAASQYQRRLEAGIRKWKTVLAVENAKGEFARPEVVIQAKNKITEWNKRMKSFIGDTQLKRQYSRERIAKTH